MKTFLKHCCLTSKSSSVSHRSSKLELKVFHLTNFPSPLRLESPEKIFATTILAFQDSLSDEDRAQFKNYSDPHSLVKDLEEHVQKFKSGDKMSRVLACCQRIHRFATRWEPFFEVTSIVVSSHPEYAAIAWGAIQLIFKVMIIS